MDDGLVLDVSLPAKYVVKVLILVVVDDGLVLYANVNGTQTAQNVLILVVVDDGLVRNRWG